MAFIVLVVRNSEAHPVAQGSLELDVSADKLAVRARVATEEAFVASALSPEGGADSATKLWAEHGEYLLRHLRIAADGRILAGRVTQVLPPGAGTGTSGASDRVVYALEYALPGLPREIGLEENLLNEIEFAPGNRWEATFVVRIAEPAGATEGLLLTSREPLAYRLRGGLRGAATATLDRRRLAFDYLRHGVRHILAGWDHLLFIAALVLATLTLWDLVKIVSAFTFAHTITLTLAVLDVVRVPGWVVEPMIAASIVFVAVENVVRPDRARGRGRTIVAFFFGLFHGLGFAGGLLEAMAGMSGQAVGLAIVAFSAGVELGHQLIVLPLFALLRVAGRVRGGEDAGDVYRAALRYGSALISVAGVVYLIAALRLT